MKIKNLFIYSFLIIFLGNSILCKAQDRGILDSLQNSLLEPQHDTTKVKTYINIGNYYEFKIPDSAIFYFQKAETLTKKNTEKLNRCKSLQAMSLRYIGIVYYNQGSYDKALEYFFQSQNIINELIFDASAENNQQNKYNRTRDLSICLNDIGNVNREQGNYDEALKYYLKSLKISEDMLELAKGSNDKEKIKEQKKSLSKSFTSIGNIHYFQENYDKAIGYYLRSLKIFKELVAEESKEENSSNSNRYKQGLSACYNNIGMVTSDKAYDNRDSIPLKNSLYNVALQYYKKSLTISEELGDRKGMSKCYNNFGSTYKELQNYELAREYYNKSLVLKEELGDKNGMATVLGNLAELHINIADSICKTKETKRANFIKAIEYGIKSFELANDIDSKLIKSTSAAHLMRAYTETGNPVLALEYANIYISLKNSLFSDEKTQVLADMETKYQAEKKQLEIDKLEKQKALDKETIARKEAESKKHLLIIYVFVVGFILILIFSFVIFRLFMAKKRANTIISIKNSALQQANEEISSQRDEIEAQRDLVIGQKEQIEKIHEEVTSSIRYAQRIQGALLPAKEQLHDILGEHFILYLPRNIVSGDFYWATKIKKWLILCVADCTGHGVPGAFMSMLGISFINEIVRKEEVTYASDVLNYLRENVINSLKQKGLDFKDQSEKNRVIDGMDISLCAINTENLMMQFAGANNPVYIVRKSDSENYIETAEDSNDNKILSNGQFQLEEIKGDKMPIAIYPKMEKFACKEIQLIKGDTIFLFSDGYSDQFGGPNRRKFMNKRFKEMLLLNADKTLTDQKEILVNTMNEWIGEYEQIDDITILGMKI